MDLGFIDLFTLESDWSRVQNEFEYVDKHPNIYDKVDEEEGTNKYIPLYDSSSSKLARATHVDMMAKVQINMYAAGLHRQGSGAVTHYTMLELADRFKLMNLALDQEDYRVDKNLEIIDSPVEKDS